MTIKIIYEADTKLTNETKDAIQDLADFALQWYTKEFVSTVTDLDTMRFFLYPVEGHTGVYGIANDGANIDRVSVREDLYVDGDFTSTGYNTLCHELIHFCQYATDFERRYDVPYAERPQEVQAFKFSHDLLAAWRSAKLPRPVIDIPLEEDDDIIPTSPTTSLAVRNRPRNIWLSIGVIALVALFLTGCAGKRASDFSQASDPQSAQQQEPQSAGQPAQQQERRLRERVLKWLFRLGHSENSVTTQPLPDHNLDTKHSKASPTG